MVLDYRYFTSGNLIHVSPRKRSAGSWQVSTRELGRMVRDGRDAKGMTQEELAYAANLAVATLRKIETGHTTEPGVFTVLILWAILGLAPTDLTSLVSKTPGGVQPAP